jgi:hypothetical protein
LVEAVKKRQGLERKMLRRFASTYVCSKSKQRHIQGRKSIVLLSKGRKMLRCFRDLGIRASRYFEVSLFPCGGSRYVFEYVNGKKVFDSNSFPEKQRGGRYIGTVSYC